MDRRHLFPVAPGTKRPVVAGLAARLRIVELLLKGPLGVGEIAEMLGVSPYNVSKHLRICSLDGIVVTLF
jgi:DNA-binding transcriptional ArsR family regulator